MSGDVDLFGNPVPTKTVKRKSAPVINDMTLMEDVLRTAKAEFGYVLIGASERVFRQVEKETVEEVPRYEGDAVHQLIDAGWLKVGSARSFTWGRHSGPGRLVLVPKNTRHTSARWDALERPATWPASDGS